MKDLNETVNYLMKSIPDYNSKPHGALYGLTPLEVLEGKFHQEINLKNRRNRLEGKD